LYFFNDISPKSNDVYKIPVKIFRQLKINTDEVIMTDEFLTGKVHFIKIEVLSILKVGTNRNHPRFCEMSHKI